MRLHHLSLLHQNKIPLNPLGFEKKYDAKYSGKSSSFKALFSNISDVCTIVHSYSNELIACFSVLFHPPVLMVKKLGIFSQQQCFKTCALQSKGAN